MKHYIVLTTILAIIFATSVGKVADAQIKPMPYIAPTPAIVIKYPSNPSQDLLNDFAKINKQRHDAAVAKQKAIALEKQRAAQLAAQEVRLQVVTQPVYQAPASPTIVSNCGEGFYQHFIYSHESGCNTSQWTGNCYGIGQDCNNIVYNLCGPSYACQNAYFTRYMLDRYGSWANAYAIGMSRGTSSVNDGWGWW